MPGSVSSVVPSDPISCGPCIPVILVTQTVCENLLLSIGIVLRVVETLIVCNGWPLCPV